MYQLVEHPLVPFTTLAGSTKGPCVNVGVATVTGAPVYVGQQETRSVLKAFGWPAPEAHQDAVAERDAAVAEVARLEGELAVAHQQVAALHVVAGMIRKANPKPARRGGAA